MQFNVTDTTPNARTIASYSGTATVAQLDDHTAIKAASRELLAQMGVQLTDRAIADLGATSSQQSINAQTALARGITAQQSGTVVEALAYYYQAASFDTSLLEAASRASAISATIASGNIGENVRNDIQRRNAWKKILDEADAFFQRHLPFEVVYDPALAQGKIDYNKQTVDLSFRVTVEFSDAAFKVLADIRKGLIESGRMKEWGFDRWPLDGQSKLFSMVWGGSNEWFPYKDLDIEAVLINEHGRIIGRGKRKPRMIVSFAGDTSRFAFVNPYWVEYRLSSDHSNELKLENEPRTGLLTFSNVNANAITDRLTVQITGVNGVNVQDPANQGYISIKTGSLSR